MTLFTKIINGEIPATIIYQDDDVVAFADISPQAPVHVLIVPRREIPTVNDLTEGDAVLVGKMALAAQKIAREAGISEGGYRLVMNCNADAGQTVFHLHMHLLGGRQMSWPPG
jgi:histidine triad (HIT) family protein